MKRLVWFLATVFVVVGMGVWPSTAQVLYFPEVYTDPLRWDDLAVRGRVDRIEYGEVSEEYWYANTSPEFIPRVGVPIQVETIILSVGEVLRGNVQASQVLLTRRRTTDPRNALVLNERLQPGTEVIATARYVVRGEPMWQLSDIFVRWESGWSRYQYRSWASPISDAEVSERVASVSLPRVTADSDLVVRGVVLSSREIGTPGNEHAEYIVRPSVVIKGVVGGDVTVRAMRYLSHDESKWKIFLTRDFDEGSEWYLFLTKKNGAYSPACGARSAWRVRGDHVFQINDVPTGYDVRSMEREIRRFAME